jgi:hypothetical protein
VKFSYVYHRKSKTGLLFTCCIGIGTSTPAKRQQNANMSFGIL